ncbi:MAG: hypothetical protein VX915_01055 [Pseudomonadota bacterium]|nr:hypothetical protein [Pseudomonadota bacterium]
MFDRRKPVPGLRDVRKYAVKVGGGENHRIGLSDQILIKENHIASAGSITLSIQVARQKHPTIKVEVETFTKPRKHPTLNRTSSCSTILTSMH